MNEPTVDELAKHVVTWHEGGGVPFVATAVSTSYIARNRRFLTAKAAYRAAAWEHAGRVFQCSLRSRGFDEGVCHCDLCESGDREGVIRAIAAMMESHDRRIQS